MNDKTNFSQLGARLKQLRKKKNITLTTLSSQCGLSVAYLSKLERDISSPNIETLQQICEALDISVIDFLQKDYQDKIHIKKIDRPVIYSIDKKVTYELLTPGNKNLKAVCIILEPNNNYSKTSWGHSTDEVGIIVEGKFLIEISKDEKYILEAGDTFYLKANTHHTFKCYGNKRCVSYWIFSSPTCINPENISH